MRVQDFKLNMDGREDSTKRILEQVRSLPGGTRRSNEEEALHREDRGGYIPLVRVEKKGLNGKSDQERFHRIKWNRAKSWA